MASPATMAPTAATIVTQTRVQPEHAEEFARWQEQLNGVIAHVPGYIDHEIIPPAPPEQVDWVIVQRFATVDTARDWLDSETRQHLVDQVLPWLVGPTDIHLFTGEAAGSSSVSAVISVRIKPGQESALRGWAQRISAVEAHYPGFQGVKLEPPVPGIQDDWTTILRFDTQQHLETWLSSSQRQQLLQEAAPFLLDTHYRTVRSGFEQWFQVGAPGTAPPVWKQNMLTLLALYPVVFLFGFFVQTPLLQRQLGMPFFLALFFGNVASVLILTWLVPWASHRFAWWLRPSTVDPRRATLLGSAAILALYALFLLVFSRMT